MGSTSDLCRRPSGFRAECPQSGGQSGGRRPRLCQNSKGLTRTLTSARFQTANSYEIAPTWLKMPCKKVGSGVFTQARPKGAGHAPIATFQIAAVRPASYRPEEFSQSRSV